MNLKTGDRIKMFEDSNIEAYGDLIENNGFRHRIVIIKDETFMEVGAPIPSKKIDSRAWAKTFRKSKRKYDRKEFAKLVGVTEQTVYSWELGRRLPKPIYWKRLSEVLGDDSVLQMLRDCD